MSQGGRARTTVGFVARLGFSLAVLGGCLSYVGIDALPAALTSVTAPALLAALLLTGIGSILIPALITRQALHVRRLELSLSELVMLNLAVRFYVLVLPRAAAMGARWLRYRRGGSGRDALALMVFERVVQLLVVTGAAVAFLGSERSLLPRQVGDLILVLASSALVALLFLFLPFVSRRASVRLGRWLGVSGRAIPGFLRHHLERLLEAVKVYQELPRGALLRMLALSAASFAFFIAAPWILVQSMQLPLSLAAVAWVRSIVFLLTLVPITVGGIGIRDIGFVALLQLYAVPEASALALSLVLLALQLALGLVGALHEAWLHLLRPSLARLGGGRP